LVLVGVDGGVGVRDGVCVFVGDAESVFVDVCVLDKDLVLLAVSVEVDVCVLDKDLVRDGVREAVIVLWYGVGIASVRMFAPADPCMT
jgi:hypothetical protein